LRKLQSGQTVSFSIHQVAERELVPVDQIDARYDYLEHKMLSEFYDYIGSRQNMKFLHWNMRDINYGFAAIEHRFRVLGGTPVVIDDDRKTDLARLLVDIFGVGYIGHPRLEKLLEKNRIQPRDFLSGHDEAAAFENKEYVRLHQSTLRKVDVLANIANRAYDRDLKVNTTWWEMRGGRVRLVLIWLAQHWLLTLVGGIASVIGLIQLFL
jgi:hypothetical protein